MTNSCIINQPKPKIEYILKAVGGSLTALPGVSDMIDASSFFSSYQNLFSYVSLLAWYPYSLLCSYYIW
jgi:hypothetical protein